MELPHLSVGFSSCLPECLRLSRRCQMGGLCPGTSSVMTLTLVLNRAVSYCIGSLPRSGPWGPEAAGGGSQERAMTSQASLSAWSFLSLPCRTPEAWPESTLALAFCSLVFWMRGHRLSASCQGSRSQGQLSGFGASTDLVARRAPQARTMRGPAFPDD